MDIERLEHREAFVAADGSAIRELAGLPHRETEEIYLFTSGAGRMRLGAEESDVRAGDMVVIAPGVRHKLWNPGQHPLVLLCCCAPPYRHEDTVLTETHTAPGGGDET